MIMAAHVIYKDKATLPASLSKYWIEDTLKGNLGFKGLAITDDITMSSIHDNYSPEQIINDYLESDMDILLVCHYEDYQNQLYNILLEKAKNDSNVREKIESKFKRILAIKFRNLY
jgi:beta-N-acetylhexosaminidase